MNERNILLSYPRSGNTWVRYILEFLSSRPSTGYDDKVDRAIAKRINLPVDINAPPIVEKKHKIYDHNYDKLVVIVRDYKECLIRHSIEEEAPESLEKKVIKKFDEETNGKQPNVDYIEIIHMYDESAGPKIMIYYEDLILNPKNEIIRLCDFFGLDRSKVDDFLNNYTLHVNNGIKSYHTRSITQGKETKSHQNKVKKETLKYMTDKLKEKHPVLFEKYLKRYE